MFVYKLKSLRKIDNYRNSKMIDFTSLIFLKTSKIWTNI